MMVQRNTTQVVKPTTVTPANTQQTKILTPTNREVVDVVRQNNNNTQQAQQTTEARFGWKGCIIPILAAFVCGYVFGNSSKKNKQ